VPPRFAAHRGGAALWPENSLDGFAGSLALGLDLLELDVHLSADGEAVVIHDATLERTTEGTGPVRSQPAAALRRLRLRARDGTLTDARVPMLGDVLALAAGAGAEILLEMKGPTFAVHYHRAADGRVRPVRGPTYDGLEERVLACLDAAGMRERTIVMAFNPAVIARMRSLSASCRATLLVGRKHVEQVGARATDAVEWAEGLGVTDLGLEHTLIDADVVSVARGRGLRLGAWTVNDEPALRRLTALGVDLITTDRPDLAVRVRDGGA
jgi:glycerophosphoryl diester phosphodiesterase